MNFIENETPQKLRGGYYTDAAIAAYLTRWVLETQPCDILEPSCGDGAFVRALASMRHNCVRSLTACELDAQEVAKARRTAADLGRQVKCDIKRADFLRWTLDALKTEKRFDAIIGNPPFIRYQYLEAELQASAEKLIRSLGLRFTKHTNAWVPFVVGSLALLRPKGRLAMVVPAEILHVLHADSVREFLLRTCAKTLILDPEEIWFENTLQGVVLLFAERRFENDAQGVGELAINPVRGHAFLDSPASEQFSTATFVPGSQLSGKWMTALLTKQERSLLKTLQEHPDIHQFGRIAKPAVGIVTGANKFFLVSDSTVEKFGLEKFAHPMYGRSEHVAGVIYDDANHISNKKRGLPANFIWIDGVPRSKLPASVRRYIELGESEHLHTRYKCRIREPWYSVPSVFTAPVGMLKRCHEYPRLVLNELDAFTTDTAYRITCAKGKARTLVGAFVNSLTALSAELEGRHYGGGVLEMVPSEINRLLVPLPNVNVDVRELDTLFRAGRSSVEILAIQDQRILGSIGLSPIQREELMAAWWKLRSRRHRSPQPDSSELTETSEREDETAFSQNA